MHPREEIENLAASIKAEAGMAARAMADIAELAYELGCNHGDGNTRMITRLREELKGFYDAD